MASFQDSLDEAIMFLEDSDGLAPAIAVCAAALLDERSYSKPRVALSSSSMIRSFIHELALASPTLRDLVKTNPAFRRVRRAGGFVVTCFGMPHEPASQEHNYEYQVCISYASEDREVARRIARKLKKIGSAIKVFFDEFEQHRLVGEPLTEMLYDVYANKSLLCIVLFSEAYSKKDWTRVEIRAARDRAIRSRGPYILPVVLDEHSVPPEFQTIGYWRLTSRNESKLIDGIWERLDPWFQANYMSLDDIVECINRDRLATVILDGFREGTRSAPDGEAADFLRLLGLIAAATTQEMTTDVRSLLDYVLFGYPAVANRFDRDDHVLVFGKDSKIKRILGRHGPLVLNKGGWDEHIEKYAEMWREQEAELVGGDSENQEQQADEDSIGPEGR